MNTGRYLMLCASTLLLAACEIRYDSDGGSKPPGETETSIAELRPADVTLDGEQLFIACQGCHTLEEGGAHLVGPNLHGIIGEAAGSRPGYDYSEAMKSQTFTWNAGTLSGFIVATEHMVPGTWMAYQNILTASELPILVEYIIRQSGGEKTGDSQ